MNDTPSEEMNIMPGDQGQAEHELELLDLKDGPLERRIRGVADDLLGQPEYPSNVASGDASAIKAAYRVFSNERVSAEGIVSCQHVCATNRWCLL